MDAQVLALVERAADRLEPFPRRMMAAMILYVRSLALASSMLLLKGEVATAVRNAFNHTVRNAFPQLVDLVERGASMVDCVVAVWNLKDEEERLTTMALFALLIHTLYEMSVSYTLPAPRPWG